LTTAGGVSTSTGPGAGEEREDQGAKSEKGAHQAYDVSMELFEKYRSQTRSLESTQGGAAAAPYGSASKGKEPETSSLATPDYSKGEFLVFGADGPTIQSPIAPGILRLEELKGKFGSGREASDRRGVVAEAEALFRVSSEDRRGGESSDAERGGSSSDQVALAPPIINPAHQWEATDGKGKSHQTSCTFFLQCMYYGTCFEYPTLCV
jgi:hypothetical protein